MAEPTGLLSDLDRTLLSAEQIHARVGELAARIEADCRGRLLTVVALMDGALFFVADLLRRTEAAHDGCQIGSYPFFREGRVGANFVVRSVSAESLAACCDSLANDLAESGHTVTRGGI